MLCQQTEEFVNVKAHGTFTYHWTLYKLNQIITEYGLTISVQKTKKKKKKGRDPVRTKIVIYNKIIEQVNSFNYLGNMIS
jgi:hypothetical protein